MKIAVYTIALNEEKHVKRWFDSAKAADKLVIADTGSTDKTRSIARSLGIEVTQIDVTPWRFDVARNASLALIPENFDICIQLDMDEVLPIGWRAQVEAAFEAGNVWPIYKHVTSRDENHLARTYQNYFKIHPRIGFYWKYPIHEVLVSADSPPARKVIDLEVDHLQDPSKDRSSYLPLLELAINEMPFDWRMNHYLNREYFYRRDWLAVLRSAYETVKIPGGWDVERASTCMWASEACKSLGLNKLAIEWAKDATEAAPEFYEAWHWRSHIAHLNENWPECLTYASKLNDLQRQEHHLVKSAVWEWWGNDLIALSNHKLGNHFDALHFGRLASWANPSDLRLRRNLEIYLHESDKNLDLAVKEIPVREKMKDFPLSLILHLESATERFNTLTHRLADAGINDFKWISAVKSLDAAEIPIQNSIYESHVLALKYFLEQTTLEWVVILEDDINFELVQDWPFTWSEKFQEVERLGIDIFQMVITVNNVKDLNTRLHPRREGYDWCSAAYLVSRKGAERILAKKSIYESPCESNLWDGQGVKCEALLNCDTEFEDAVHIQYRDLSVLSFQKSTEEMRRRVVGRP